MAGTLLLSILGLASLPLAAFEPGPRLAWQESETRAVCAGVYGRVRKLSDGSLMLAYSDGPSCQVRRSTDGGRSFGAAVIVASDTGYDDTNAELIELGNGCLLFGYNCRPQAASQGRLSYQIRTRLSRDFGATWEAPVIAYEAGKTGDVGCWEPVFLQLPSGKVLLFFANEAPFPDNTDQEIGMLGSDDQGASWKDYRRIAYRARYRDGMPVPALLADGQTLACAIEDNGLVPGNFKPTLLTTTLSDLWTSGALDASSPKRWGALRSDVLPPAYTTCAAPYLAVLPDGSTVLSIQGDEGRTSSVSMPRVYLGSSAAKDFHSASIPFPWLPSTATGLWNSLTVLDEDTVALVSSVAGVPTSFGNEALWLSKARVLRPLRAQRRPDSLPHPSATAPWPAFAGAKPPLFIGSDRGASLTADAAWDDTQLHVRLRVTGSPSDPTAASCRLEIYLDPQNLNTSAVVAGLRRYGVRAAVTTPETWQGSASGWATASGSLATVSTAGDASGYTALLSIPWSELGGRPALGSGWGLHLRMADSSQGSTRYQDLGDDNPDRPATWFQVSLEDDQGPPQLLLQPLSQTLSEGKDLTLSVQAGGYGPFTYTWTRDGSIIPGATEANLTLSGLTQSETGNYVVIVGNPSGNTQSIPARVSLAEGVHSGLANLSTRALVNRDSSVLIAGFVVSGSSPRRLLVRGIGPALASTFTSLFKADEVAHDTEISVYSGSSVIASDDNWSAQPIAEAIGSAASGVGAFALPSGSLDASLVLSVGPGAYTAILRSKDGTPRIGLVELYDLDDPGRARLTNLSSRGFVSPGKGLMISGLSVRGEARRFLIRGIGPGLTALLPELFPAGSVLADPKLRIVDSSGTVVASNDNWQDSDSTLGTLMQAAGAFALPVLSRDSALAVTLPDGNYTALVEDRNEGSGIALVEIYDLNP